MKSAFEKWLKEQHRKTAEQQKNDPDLPEHLRKFNTPYYGAIGGSLSNHYLVDSTGAGKHFAKHANQEKFDFGDFNIKDISYHDVKNNFESVAKEGHQYEIILCSTSIGLIVTIKDLTTNESFDFSDL